VNVIAIIGDILDRQKMNEVLEHYRPDVIYHAAAYKHVPLMEDHPLEAINNNLFGTEVVARAALTTGVRKFVFVSTDKAVAPVGIMGMTKRAAEGLLLALSGGSTVFAAVRFGNVLGSDGSVLPLFRWQLASGLPLTVTDENATRYFMLISEAAQLVLQAGAMARGGEVYFLDMGRPVRIMKLAEDFLRLSGRSGVEHLPIEVVGLRPGERLTEELVRESERLERTGTERISVSQKKRFDPDDFDSHLERLRYEVEQRNVGGAVNLLRSMMELY
jgi:FlaA1/EpsC-like NDP-sugar epimerase